MNQLSQSTKLRVPPPLPADIDDWQRAIKAERTLNDLVEDVHRSLVSDRTVENGVPRSERYLELLRATYDQHAVTGSLSFDNCKACEMLQAKAKEMRVTELATEKLAIINMALGVVLRRYKSSRKQRRNMIHGEEVPNDNNNGE